MQWDLPSLETLKPLVALLLQPRALGFLNCIDPLDSASNYYIHVTSIIFNHIHQFVLYTEQIHLI